MLRRRLALLAALAALLLPTSASTPPPRQRPETRYVEPPELVKLRGRGNELYRAADYAGAARIYEEGLEAARQRGDRRSSLRFLNNLGSVSFELLRYRDAARVYLRARATAEEEGDSEMLAAASFNLSSVYLQLGEVDAAREAAERGIGVPPGVKFRPRLLIQRGLIAAQEGDCDGAIRRLREAIAAAEGPAEAQAWNELGNVLLECRRFPEAEEALLESYRLRKLSRDPRLHFSYESLAELRLEQNDPASAARLLDRAIEIASDLGPAALWRPLYSRGRANRALGKTQVAYDDLRRALVNLKDWRAQVLPADAFRIRSEAESHRVHSAFIEAAAARARESGSSAFAEEAFAAAESGRAASLRALWVGAGRPRQLPDEYWRARDDLRRAETEYARGETDDAPARAIRARLAEMEAAAGLALSPALDATEDRPAQLLRTLRAALGPDEAYIAFHTGEEQTRVWAVTRDRFEMATAPAEADLQSTVAAFVDALRADKPEAAAAGSRLFGMLFSGLGGRVLSMNRWTIAPDGPLFDLPFAALTDDGRALLERRSVRITIGAAGLLRPPGPAWTESFVGLGDPVYNRADSRQPGAAAKPARSALELPRLPGSGREVESCAAIWRSQGRPAAVLSGADATRDRLARALAGRPAIAHVAAHMLFPPDGVQRGWLALAIQPQGDVELLSETEVAGMDAGVGLVVLNGCSSGRGAALPGAGLLGMTRAWLAAGARAVIATRWPAPDQDSGALFESLYRLYFERRQSGTFISFGDLLREAQLAEARAGGNRAKPSRWASYFCVETN